MIKRVVIFEDEPVAQRKLQELARTGGWEPLVIDNGVIDRFADSVLEFNPDLAIVDIGFPGSDVAGLHILRFLRTRTKTPIVVCSVQMDSPESSRLLYDRCQAIGGVAGLFGKRTLPSWRAILDSVTISS